jgi:MerR family transcriptional regulator, light-induced transcriptional regulator
MSDEILHNAKSIVAVPFSAAADYSENQDRLVDEVNKALTDRTDVKRLIGQKPLSVMYDNHKNHAAFMSNVFKLKDYVLMSRVIIWVYHTYHVQGFAYDYFPVAMQAWIDAVEKHLDPSKTEPLLSVYRWIIANHELLIEASLDQEEPPLFVEQRWRELKEIILATLVAGGHHRAIELANENVHSAADLTEFYLQVIQPAMYQIGNLWENGEISVAREHLASAIVTRVMASLYPKYIVIEQTKGQAVVTAAPNEFHEIGPRMVADLLEIDGWDIDYTGANTPSQDLLDLALEKTPFFIAISVGMPFNLDRTQELVKMIREKPQLKDTKIMVGGHSLKMSRQTKDVLGVDALGDSARDAVMLASEWWDNA